MAKNVQQDVVVPALNTRLLYINTVGHVFFVFISPSMMGNLDRVDDRDKSANTIGSCLRGDLVDLSLVQV